jgi:hypothetical protein
MIDSPRQSTAFMAPAQDRSQSLPYPRVQRGQRRPVAVFEVFKPSPKGPVDVLGDFAHRTAWPFLRLLADAVFELGQALRARPPLAPLEGIAQTVKAASLPAIHDARPLGDGTWGGVALLDHSSNPRHPTPWHNWNNMTITASFTFHEPFTLKPGAELTLRYRVLVHAGDADKAGVEEAWKEFART